MKVERNKKLLYASKQIELSISEINYAYLDREWNREDFCASFTRIYFPIEGEAILTVKGEEIRLCPGRIYVIPAGVSFSGFCPERLDKIYVHLTLTQPDGSDVFRGIDRCIVLDEEAETVKHAERLYRESSIVSLLEFKLLIYELLVRALRIAPLRDPSLKTYSEITRHALDYVKEHLSATLSVDEVSRALFLPKSTLQRRFRAEVGKPLGRYIDDCLTLRAETELLDPTLSIGDVSDRLGFCDQFYFSRKFKKAHGISPRVFRQKYHV